MRKHTLLNSTLAALALIGTSASFAEQPTAQQYRYGQSLDVAEVVSLREAAGENCEVVEAQMVYRDSSGELQALTYLKQADICHSQG